MRLALVVALAACGSSAQVIPDAFVGDPGPIDAAVPTDGMAPPPSGRWVLGYYVGYQVDAMPIASIPWSALTHIALAPMVVKSDLTLDLTFDDSHGTGIADAMALSAAAHAHQVVPLLML